MPITLMPDDLDRLANELAAVIADRISPLVDERRPFFTTETLAQHLAISERTIRDMLARGHIASYKIGASRRISPEDVDSYLAGCREG